jgi:polyhydroxybutyrate depolymerase
MIVDGPDRRPEHASDRGPGHAGGEGSGGRTDHGPRHTTRGPGSSRRPRTVATWVLSALAATVALAACGGGPSRTATTTPTTPSPSGTSASNTSGGSGCGTAAPVGSTTLTLTVAGRSRTVIVHVPTGYSDSSKAPLVLNMHGSGSTATDQEAFTGMDATADSDGFVVAYPQGVIPDASGFDWNVPGVPLIGGKAVPAGSPDDVTFLTTLVHILEGRYCIDADRVYATGFSGGARIASQLACDASSTFAAVAPVSGLRRPTPCPTTRPVPILAFHGTADPVDPYAGHGQAYWTYSVPQAAKDWSAQDHCSSTPATSQIGSGATLTRYGGCGGGTVVELYSITGEGHEWPSGPHLPKSLTRLLGPQSDAVNANTVMWAFFAAHPLS